MKTEDEKSSLHVENHWSKRFLRFSATDSLLAVGKPPNCSAFRTPGVNPI